MSNIIHHIFGASKKTSQQLVTLNSDKNRGNVLLSYIVQPFLNSSDNVSNNFHSNQWECLEIASIWKNMGYNVDIINWDDKNFVPQKKYDVLIDIHSNLERLAPMVGKNCIKVLHITGSHWLFQNKAEYERLLSLQGRKNVTLYPKRIALPSLAIEYADYITILGNDFTISTFRHIDKPFFKIPVTSTMDYPWPEGKNFEECKNKFLWFGGTGLVLKGLDLVLEAFSEMPENDLVVCGPIKSEPDFERTFKKELYETPNIKTAGLMDVSSKEFLNIIKNCSSIVYPSGSEGCASSVILCLHAGLIPIISYQSGVDVNDFGIILKECSVEEIIKSVRKINSLTGQELEAKSRKAWEFARKMHTRKNFSDSYTSFVLHLLKQEVS